jgi:Tfp pilus assembly protein PilN
MKAVNLLPPDLRGAARPASVLVVADGDAASPTGAFAVLGVLAFCVVALAAYVLTGNTVKDRQAQLDSVSRETAVVTAQAERLKPYADFAEQAQQRIQTVKDLAASRFDWEQSLRDVSRVVPAGVTLSTLDGAISGTGGASGSSLGGIAAPSIKLTGCTTGGQPAVATLMSRLRSVDGVTRVSLSKSDKPDAATGATAPAQASTGAAAGCGAGRAPQFELTVYFERSKVQQTAVGGAATGATATTTSAPAGSATPAPSATSTPSGAQSTPTPTTSTTP